MDTKTSGYIFLFVGIFIMTFSVVLVILAFTGIIHPSYFSNVIKNITPPSPKVDINSLSQSGQLNLSTLIPSLNIIPPGVLDQALNLSSHFLLMSFVGGFGYKLAMIGVNLIRPIVIKSGKEVFETEAKISAIEDSKNSSASPAQPVAPHDRQ